MFQGFSSAFWFGHRFDIWGNLDLEAIRLRSRLWKANPEWFNPLWKDGQGCSARRTPSRLQKSSAGGSGYQETSACWKFVSPKSQDEGTGSVGIRGGACAICSPICLRILATSCESLMKAMIRIGSPHSQADARVPGPFHQTKVNAWLCNLDRPHKSGRKRPQRSHDHTPSSAHALYRSQESRIQERQRTRPRPLYA